MSSFGKKFLSAFVEINDKRERKEAATENLVEQPAVPVGSQPSTAPDDRFSQHFDKLFAEADLPTPGYYEFSKMTDAMQSITDAKARYSAALAGLQVQGLNKDKLLSSARQYARLLEADAEAFNSTIREALEEKVAAGKREIEQAKNEVASLSQRIASLQQQIVNKQKETEENEAKIYSRHNGYMAAQQSCRQRLDNDITQIEQHIL